LTWVHHFINGLEIRPDGSKEENFKEVSGYSILEAVDIDEAISLLEITHSLY
jgi:hypothetical protein